MCVCVTGRYPCKKDIFTAGEQKEAKFFTLLIEITRTVHLRTYVSLNREFDIISTDSTIGYELLLVWNITLSFFSVLMKEKNRHLTYYIMVVGRHGCCFLFEV